MNKGEKWEVGGHTKGDERVRRGRGVEGAGGGGVGPFPNHLDLLFQDRG